MHGSRVYTTSVECGFFAPQDVTARKPKGSGYIKRGTAIKVPDDVIRAMRRMHEIERKPYAVVYAAFPQYSDKYIRDVLSYTIRASVRI